MPTGIQIGPVTAAEWPTAARVLLGTAPRPESAAVNFLLLIAEGDVDPAGLLVARGRGGRLRGAVLAYLLGGGQAGIWPPVVAAGADTPAVENALAAAAVAWARANGAGVVQSLVRPGDDAAGRPLAAAGLTLTTTLALLHREITPADADPPAPPFPVEPFAAVDPGLFADVLVASYEGSLDVPELNDSRGGEDILAGYRESAPSGDGEWFLARVGGEPAAVLLLAGGREPWTFTYLGVVPAARGRGLGKALTKYALGRVAAGGGQRVVLNVDERNLPAIHMYESSGFSGYDRRAVFLSLPPA